MERKLQRAKYLHWACSAPNCRKKAHYYATISNGQSRNKCEKHALQYAIQYDVEHPGATYKKIEYSFDEIWLHITEPFILQLEELQGKGWEVIAVSIVENVKWGLESGARRNGMNYHITVRKPK